MTRIFYLKGESAGARKVATKDGFEFWIPRSVCPTTFKYPPDKEGRRLVQIEIEDWWWQKNGMEAKCGAQASLKL